jgi:DNA anti-recombination protein RmuC
MFIPVEPAFLLAIDRQPELISEALKNNIMLVSPTTLLVALRTIANLWRYEHQSRNAQKIAERAGGCTTKCACSWMICPPSGRAWIKRRITIARR